MINHETHQRSKTNDLPKQAVYQTFYSEHDFSRMVFLPQGNGQLQSSDGANISPYVFDEQKEWLHCVGVNDAALLQTILAPYGIHELVIEDILSPKQRPKIEDYGTYLFIALRVCQYSGSKLHNDSVYLIIGTDYILSFQKKPLGLFSDLHQQFAANKYQIRSKSIEFLAYHFIDRIVDDYFNALEQFNECVESLDNQLFKQTGEDETLLAKIHKLKRDATKFQRNLIPMREIAGQLLRGRFDVFSNDTHLYLRDVYDHILQLIESLDAARDTVVSMMDVQLSFQSNRLNQQMRVLTVITIIFMPLTVITGIYGMNFDNMPELHWQYGYFMVLGLLLMIIVSLLVYFRKRGWL
ncbi:magnesium/cobalt transporter CorA [Neisseriaceae bacterium B1]